MNDPDEVAFLVGVTAQSRVIDALEKLRDAFAELDDAFAAYMERHEDPDA